MKPDQAYRGGIKGVQKLTEYTTAITRAWHVPVLLALLLTVATASTADTVWTTDGSKLVGNVEQWTEGKLVIATEIAGRLEIDASKITAISTEQPVNVDFTSGDRLVGTLDFSPEQGTLRMNSRLGEINISPAEITALWPAGTESPEMIALKAEMEKAREAAKPKWSATLEAGTVITDGNTEKVDARGRFTLERRTHGELLKFTLAGEYSEQDDQRTENEYWGGILYENTFYDHLFWFTRYTMEFDEFEDLDLRATATVGTGYYWLKQPDHEFKTRVGLGYRHESYDTGQTEDDVVVDAGWDYRLNVKPWAQFTHEGTYSPSLEDLADYRLDLDSAFTFPLDDKDLWKFKTGMRNEYSSMPQPGLDRLDNTYYANIVVKLK